jgi:hypothetical protein
VSSRQVNLFVHSEHEEEPMNKGTEHKQAAPRRPGERRSPRRVVVAVTALLAIATLTAGCSSSSGPSVASAGSSSSAAAASGQKPSTLAYAQCMISHGVKNFPEPNSQGQIQFTKGQQMPDASSPQFQAAAQACKTLNPASVAISPAEQAKHQAALVEYAKCMRAHGVPDFPDPATNGSFDVGGINPGSPQVQTADKACSSPGVGLFQGRASAS